MKIIVLSQEENGNKNFRSEGYNMEMIVSSQVKMEKKVSIVPRVVHDGASVGR
jgi:hypothetical protein